MYRQKKNLKIVRNIYQLLIIVLIMRILRIMVRDDLSVPIHLTIED